MKHTARILATSAFAVAFAAIGSGLSGAAPGDPDEPIGPFDQLSACQHEGNLRMENEGWNDYECVGTPPSVLLYRR